MSSPVSNVDTTPPPPLYPTLNTNSNPPNPLTSSPTSYVSLLDSCETPG